MDTVTPITVVIIDTVRTKASAVAIAYDIRVGLHAFWHVPGTVSVR